MSRSTLPEINRTKALENTRWKIFTARMLEPTNHPCFYRKMIWTPNLLNLQGVLGGAPKGHFRVYFCFGKGNWFSIHIPNQSGVVDNLWPEPNPHFKRDFLHKMQVLHIHVIRFREHSGYEDVLFNDKHFIYGVVYHFSCLGNPWQDFLYKQKTPLKIYGWIIIMEVWFRYVQIMFLSKRVICRLQLLIFQGEPSGKQKIKS